MTRARSAVLANLLLLAACGSSDSGKQATPAPGIVLEEIASGFVAPVFYADHVSGRIWGLRYDGTRVTEQRELLRTPYRISTFGQDDAGELYLADHAGGRIFRIVSAGN